MKASPMTEGRVSGHILKLFFPILGGSLFQQMYGLADAMIVGRYLGKEALGAVGGSSILVINFILYLIIGLANGITVVAAQAYGSGQRERYRQIGREAVRLTLTAGILFAAAGTCLAEQILKWMDTPEEMMELSVIYLRTYSISFLPAAFYNMGAGLLRVKGDNASPLKYLAAASCLNLILVLLFILVFRMGVRGTAAATVLAQCFSAFCILCKMRKGEEGERVDVFTAERNIGNRKKIWTDILKIGIPTGMQSDLYLLANMLMQVRINSYGTDCVAAFSAYGRIDSFFWVIMSAYGIAVMTFCGSNYGARQYDRIRQGIRVTTIWAMASAALFSLFTVTCCGRLMRLFSGDESVIGIGIEIYKIVTPFYAAYVMTEIFSGGIRGCGKTLVPMALTCIGVCLIRIVWTLCIGFMNLGMNPLMVSYPVTWMITSLAFVVYYKKGRWLLPHI